LAAYQRAVNVNSQSIEAQLALANLAIEQQEFIRAIVAYREAARLDPQNARAYYQLGIALKARGRRTEAITALQEAQALYQQQGKSDEAKKAEAALKDLR